ncbi:exosortase B [Cognatazoarcus halotolerans]|uniref:exosortase B n=1 Tax=Cognatazoarcus halotolerans TaxID=2686016 RepID=UPI00190F53B3|nr:exosortase B [Cognatazoarcus halotolerans]MBX3680960.1 exosortase B [Rhodocyclaceae bacterium]MCB1898614.1 exosortase B [Rhodocyclaceae bacterium]
MHILNAMNADAGPGYDPQTSRALPWLVLLAGLAFMYVPSFVDLFRGIWSSSDQAHGPIVFCVALWLLYRKWPEVEQAERESRSGYLAWPVLVIAGFAYVLGRSQQIVIFEIGSLIPALAGSVLLLRGRKALAAVWFPLFFMIFMIPLPGFFVDAVTQPMKMAVSYFAEAILFAAGYPIARSGVILQIGQYQLLVADACAGLHTLFTLEAMGLLYLNLVQHSSAVRNIVLALLIIPISFVSNVVRVIVLTLVTYHLGDEAGQGFLHGFAGMVLFLSGLLLIIVADSLLRIGTKGDRGSDAAPGMRTT